MIENSWRFCVLLLVGSVCGIGACTKQDEEGIQDHLSYILQSAMSEAGSQSAAVEGANSPIVNSLSSCTYAAARSACSGSVRQLIWNNCSLTNVTLNGIWIETFNSADACNNFTNTSGLANNGDSVIRKTALNTIALNNGVTITVDTLGGIAWDNTVINSNGVTITQGTGSTRTIQIDGIHRRLKGPSGVIWFDHFVTGNLTVTGKRSAGNRMITSGTLTVYHNLAKFTATNTMTGVTWGSSLCCYPTSGIITTTFSGSVTGTASLNFSPGATSCGAATFTDTSNQSSSITLSYCQ